MEPKTIVAIVLVAFIIGGRSERKTGSEPITYGAER